jgi:hypothetical protein
MMVTESYEYVSYFAGGEGAPRGLTRAYGELAGGDNTNKDGVHLMVVQDGLV